MSTDETNLDLDRLLTWLQKRKPVPKRLKVMCTDSETREIPVPATRQKWQKLKKILGALDWLRVETYTARGEYQDGFESENAGEDYGDDESTTNAARDIAFYNAVARQVKLNGESVKDALAAQEKHNKSLLDGAAKCIEMVTMAALSLQRTYEMRIGLLDQIVDEQGEGQGGLLSGKFMDHMGEQIAKAAAPHIIGQVAGKGGAKRRTNSK